MHHVAAPEVDVTICSSVIHTTLMFIFALLGRPFQAPQRSDAQLTAWASLRYWR